MVTSKVTLGSHCTACFSAALAALDETSRLGNTQYCKGGGISGSVDPIAYVVSGTDIRETNQCDFRISTDYSDDELSAMGATGYQCSGVLPDCIGVTVGVCLGCALGDLSYDGNGVIDEKRLKEIWSNYKKAKCCDVQKDSSSSSSRGGSSGSSGSSRSDEHDIDIPPKPNDYLCKEPCKIIECAIKTYKKECPHFNRYCDAKCDGTPSFDSYPSCTYATTKAGIPVCTNVPAGLPGARDSFYELCSATACIDDDDCQDSKVCIDVDPECINCSDGKKKTGLPGGRCISLCSCEPSIY